MLGTIYDIWDKSKSVPVKEGEQFITIQGKRFEVNHEENYLLRLSLVKTVDNRYDQHQEAVVRVMNLREKHQSGLAMVKQKLKELTSQLVNDELEQDTEEELFEQVREKRLIKKKHEEEIKKLMAQTTVRVNYSVVRSGLSALLTPGLTLQPEFLTEPVCWCPSNIPKSQIVEKTTSMSEELPLTFAQNFSATGVGLEDCLLNQEAKFLVNTKDDKGQRCDVNGDNFAIESKEAEIKSSVSRKEPGIYEITYFADADVKECEKFSMSVTHLGCHIQYSPFTVNIGRCLLLEISSSKNYNNDWLNDAVMTMSTISRAKLWVKLYDDNGLEVYNATGVTSCKWSENNITAPGSQFWDNAHTNVIKLDNGDGMMIVGKSGMDKTFPNDSEYAYSAYYSFNIIVNKGWDGRGNWNHPRRMIIARNVTNVPGWTTAENLISFSNSGFTQTTSGKWPKFKGVFRIYYEAL